MNLKKAVAVSATGPLSGGLRKRLFWLVLSMTCDSIRGQAYASEFASLIFPRFGPKVTQV